MKKFVLIASLIVPFSANAGCLEVAISHGSSTPCQEDNHGNTYHTEQNLGGNYNTYRNGILDSQTSQNLSGGYQKEYTNGRGVETYNYNPSKSKPTNTNGLYSGF